MATVSMIGFLEVLLLLGGGFGLPLGVPPEPADPMLARVAPADCLLYLAWAGTAQPSADSKNRTERLLAEAEIQQLTEAILKQINAAIKKLPAEGNPPQRLMIEEGPRLLKALLTRPTALFVADANVGPGGVQVDAGLMVNLGDNAENVGRALDRIRTELLGGQAEEVDFGGGKFYRFQPAPQAPPVTCGIRGKYLILAVGEKAADGIRDRVRQDPPKWLTGLLDRSRIDRVSHVMYLNIGKLRDKLLPLIPEPKVAEVIDALGLKGLSVYASVGGLDETGFASRTWIDLDGEPRGLLKLVDAPPLTAADLKPIPQDALAAIAFRLNLADVLDIVLKTAEAVEPRAADEIRGGIGEVEEALGVRLREDLRKALGDVWTLHTAATDGGLISGWTATVQVRDAKRMAAIHQQLLDLARKAATGRRDPQIRQLRFAETDIYYLVVPDDDFPLTPAWCLTDRELVIGLFPQAVKSYVARGPDYRSLAQNPTVAAALQDNAKPLAVVYADVQSLFRTVYPFLQIGAQIALQQAGRAGFELDPILIPSPGVIDKHLLPFVLINRRTETGIEIYSHQTLPGINVGATLPVAVALILPPMQSARGAARRSQSMNNLKQIGIALHNYHDTFRGLPAAYSTDKEGKPLLSWRVFILPYIEQQALFEQFHLDEPWDSAHNRKLIAQMPPAYQCPDLPPDAGKTVYLGVAGKDGIFLPPKKERPADKFPVGARLADVLDGTANTVAVVEATRESATIWTKPDDFVPNAENPLKGLLGLRPGGFNVLFCDGSVRFLPQTIDAQTLLNLFHKSDGQAVRLP